MSTRADTLATFGEEVNSSITTLNSVLARSGDTIKMAAHQSWVELVKIDHILFRLDLNRKILDESGARHCVTHEECRLGKWYYSNRGDFDSSPAFREIEDPHFQFHAHARKALDAVQASDMPEALRQLDVMEKDSVSTFQALERFANENPEAVQKLTKKVELF